MQASHVEPAIKHAVLALGSWHQAEMDDLISRPRSRLYANSQYQLALENAQTPLTSASVNDLDRVLVGCIVFSIYEAARGYHEASQQHIKNGRRILLQYGDSLNSSRRSETAEILQMLTRLDIAFADQTPQKHRNAEAAVGLNVPLEPCEFEEIRHAQKYLFDIERRLVLLQLNMSDAYADGDHQVYAELHVERLKCVPALLTWKKYFDRLLGKASPTTCDLTVLFLTLCYHAALIFARTEDQVAETQCDPLLPEFEVTVSCGEQIVDCLLRNPRLQSVISYDTGYVTCIFFAATRCRDPRLRRRAISVLKALPRQEGIWKSSSAAKIAEQLIHLEEAGLDTENINCAADVPEQKRIWQMDGSLGPDAASMTAQFCGFSPGSCSFEMTDT